MSILIALVIAFAAFAIGYVAGRARQGGGTSNATVSAQSYAPSLQVDDPQPSAAAAMTAPATPAHLDTVPPSAAASTTSASEPPRVAPTEDGAIAERARLVRSYEGEGAMLRGELKSRDAIITRLGELAEERRRLFGDLATAHGETARYRQLVIDLENNAPPPFFGVGAPDDLKLIVGVGPVLERMLQMLGVGTYRQIARWTDRDIDEFDAKLHEFPGRIRRDAWVTQARALHQSKYGESLPSRDRG